MNVSKVILELIERFDRNRKAYLSGQYNETQLRREFLDPFFETLGWDVNNKQGYAEAYKDVIHEDAIKIGSAIKAPDYCFRIGGTRKFFVEAKKPSVNLKDDVEQMLSLNKKLTSAKTDHEKTTLQRQIESTDKQIDSLVYEVYGLTEAEINIVSGCIK